MKSLVAHSKDGVPAIGTTSLHQRQGLRNWIAVRTLLLTTVRQRLDRLISDLLRGRKAGHPAMRTVQTLQKAYKLILYLDLDLLHFNAGALGCKTCSSDPAKLV
jgi:hypothetical protein